MFAMNLYLVEFKYDWVEVAKEAKEGHEKEALRLQ
jgi:hypothetical protein